MFSQIPTFLIARNEGVIAVDVPFFQGRLGAYNWSAFVLNLRGLDQLPES
jgi:hypothetical protein